MARVSTYLNFRRDTESAFLFYRSVFGGEFAGPMRRYSDVPGTPGEDELPTSDKNLITHVELQILGGHFLMGTDTPESMGSNLVQGNNVLIMLEPDTRVETDRLYEALAVNGKIDAPLAEAPWGGYFGLLADQFGVHWMFNCRSKV